MRLINITAFKITLIFLGGILCCHYWGFSKLHLEYALFFTFALFLIAWFRSGKQLFQDSFFGIVAYLILFVMGAWVYHIHQPIHHENHYTNYYNPRQDAFFQLRIKETLKPDLYNQKHVAEIIAINETVVSGDILLLIRNNSIPAELQIDDVLLIKTNKQELPKPKNPHQFDYASYLNRQGIYHQIQINPFEIIHKTKGTASLKGAANKVRSYINEKLIENNFNQETLSLINALLLGQRQQLSKDIYNDFAAAGAVHILAVSGLHVGIIMLILQFVLKPLERLRNGKRIKIIGVVLCLWVFAVIAGLSPSVLRAVTMFSFLAYAMESKRETSSFNTLLASAFLLLAIDPNLIFHIGFQMSYMAVFAIVWICPMIQKYYHPKTIIDRKIWETLTVTFAAQLGVAVLSIYYFHHFPGLFFITNVVILPFLGLILGGGILVIALASINILPSFLHQAYSSLLEKLIAFIGWVAKQDRYYFDEISLNTLQVIGLYFFLVALILAFQKLKFAHVFALFISIICLQGIYFWNKSQTASQELLVFHKSRHTVIGYKNARNLNLYSNSLQDEFRNEGFIKNYKVGAHIKDVNLEKLPPYFEFDKKRIFVTDSTGVFPKNGKVDVLIISESPKFHLDRVLDSLKPSLIIADGNNYTSYVKRWRETCTKRKLPFHHTGTEGAYIIK
ncbi:MAG: ComEC/Rec2 family competence protein [Flavobacteriaceae bacterium]